MAKIYDKPQHIAVTRTEEIEVEIFDRDHFFADLCAIDDQIDAERAELSEVVALGEGSQKRALAKAALEAAAKLEQSGESLDEGTFAQLQKNLNEGRYDGKDGTATLIGHLQMKARAPEHGALATKVASGAYTTKTTETRQVTEWIWVDADDPRVAEDVRKKALAERKGK